MQPPLYYLLMVPLFRALAEDPPRLLEDLHRVNARVYANVRAEPRPVDRIRARQRAKGASLFEASAELAYLKNLRWPSLLFGLLAILFTYRAALAGFGDRQLALLAGGLLGFTPQFIFTSAYVSNDTAATAIGASCFWLVAAALRDPARGRARYDLILALLVALALGTKNSILPSLAVAGCAIAIRDARPLAQRLSSAALAGALLLLLAGPYIAWNVSQRGDPLGMQAVWSSAAHMYTHARYGGALAYFTGTYWVWTFRSYWGWFGWMNLLAPAVVYLAYLALTGVGIFGFALAGVRARIPGLPRDTALRVYLVVAIAATLGAHIWLNFQTAQPQGRHLHPVAPELSCLLAIGLARLWGASDPHVAPAKVAVALLVLFGLALYCLFFVVLPGYE
jgi:4-amino-4-deoxy-L-arabinose transferase-like glycosyltransferase